MVSKLSIFLIIQIFALNFLNINCDEIQWNNIYEKISFEETIEAKLVQNDELLNEYMNCLLGEEKCSVRGTMLKRLIPKLILSGCTECTQPQLDIIRIVMKHLREHHPTMFDRVCKRYRIDCDKIIPVEDFIDYKNSSHPSSLSKRYYQKFDADPKYALQLMKNKYILPRYIKCFLGRGICTGYARLMKKLIPQVVATQCASCTPNQAYLIKEMIRYLREHYPHDYALLHEMYDPNSIYIYKL